MDPRRQLTLQGLMAKQEAAPAVESVLEMLTLELALEVSREGSEH